MTLRKVVKELRAQGHKISYRNRNDGGILIKSIDGKKYTSAEGNKIARTLAGKPLSEKKIQQLRKANPQKTPLQVDVMRKIRSVQRKWKAGGNKGKIKTERVRQNIKERGLEYAMQALDTLEAKALGYTNQGAIQALIDRIKFDFSDAMEEEKKIIDAIIADIEARRNAFKETVLMEVLEEYYKLIGKQTSIEDFASKYYNLVGKM